MREVLHFVAENDFVVPGQVEAFLGVDEETAQRLLVMLETAGLLCLERLTIAGPALCRVTERGLDSIGSELSAPSAWAADFRHAVGVVWLWLMFREGEWGEAEPILTRRRMELLDRARDQAPGEPPFGVLVDAAGPPPVWRYPDLVLTLAQGRAPVHLELKRRPGKELEVLVLAYMERSVAVLFLVDDYGVGTHVQAVAAKLGLSRQIVVQGISGIGT